MAFRYFLQSMLPHWQEKVLEPCTAKGSIPKSQQQLTVPNKQIIYAINQCIFPSLLSTYTTYSSPYICFILLHSSIQHTATQPFQSLQFALMSSFFFSLFALFLLPSSPSLLSFNQYIFFFLILSVCFMSHPFTPGGKLLPLEILVKTYQMSFITVMKFFCKGVHSAYLMIWFGFKGNILNCLFSLCNWAVQFKSSSYTNSL